MRNQDEEKPKPIGGGGGGSPKPLKPTIEPTPTFPKNE